jgi:hypothetical protein
MAKVVENTAKSVVKIITKTSEFALGIAFGLGSALVKKLIDIPDLSDQAQADQALAITSTPTPRMIVGEAVVSGPIIKYEKVTHSDKKEYHHLFVTLANHPCESVEAYQLDGKELSSLTGTGYYIEPRLGDQTGPPARALTYMTSVDNTFIGTGLTDVYSEFVIDTDIFANGLQDFKLKVKGLAVYDPRKDSTAGGSGSQRENDSLTWEWTDNAALIIYHWRRHMSSIDVSVDNFLLSNIASEANICDELLPYIDANGVTQYQKRYTCNGTIDLTIAHETIEDSLLTSCGGAWIESGGLYLLQVAAYRGPAVMTIIEADLAGAVSETPTVSLSDRVNKVTATYISKDDFYQSTQMTPIVSTFLRDGRDLGVTYTDPLQYPYTNHDPMAQRLANIHLLRNAAGNSLGLSLQNIALRATAGAVINVVLPKYLIDGEYEILKSNYNHANGTYEIECVETSADIYNQLQIPAERDVTPNVNIDNTFVAPVTGITFNQTASDSWRVGFLTWLHPVPTSVVQYEITIAHPSGTPRYLPLLYSTGPNIDLAGYALGNYRVFVRAKNRFGKYSTEAFADFTVSAVFTLSSLFTWIKYADSAAGAGLSDDPSGKTYIGFAYNKTTATESTTPGDYTWSLIQGPQGNTGVAGAPGANGETTYTWIKYSANADGTGLTDTPQSNTAYIGIAVNKTTATESSTKTDYVWSLFKGPQGDTGPQGVAGAPGANGQPTYTWIKYADSAAGAGLSNDPSGKSYIGFAYNKTTATESTTPSDYTWSLIQGPQGNTGVAGAPGSNGETTYTWIKYSANADGTGLTDTPQSNTAYIGIAVNKTTATESSTKTDYVWSLFKGPQGDPGADGQTPRQYQLSPHLSAGPAASDSDIATVNIPAGDWFVAAGFVGGGGNAPGVSNTITSNLIVGASTIDSDTDTASANVNIGWNYSGSITLGSTTAVSINLVWSSATSGGSASGDGYLVINEVL